MQHVRFGRALAMGCIFGGKCLDVYRMFHAKFYVKISISFAYCYDFVLIK